MIEDNGFERRGFSRRSFFKGAAVVAAGGAATALAACTPSPQSEAEGNETGVPETWDKEVDVVVVGLGGAGGAAAIEATWAGAEVLVLELTGNALSSTSINGGQVYLAGTKLQKEAGVEDSPEEMFKYLMAGKGASGDETAIRLLADSSPGLYDWCVEVGMEFLPVVGEYEPMASEGIGILWTGNERMAGFAEVAKPAPRAHVVYPERNGGGFTRPMIATLESLGVEILYGTPGRSLITNEERRVVGIRAEGSSGEIVIKARKAVVLTAGGFANNDEMLMRNWLYKGPLPASRTAAGNENGDGITMGRAIGADTQGLTNHQLGSMISRTSGPSMPKGIIVNKAGRRFIQEEAYASYLGRAVSEVENAWFIVDSPINAEFGEAAPMDPVATADTIEDLASKIGIPPAALANTLEFYNESVALGEDREFFKLPHCLVPITTPPFVAYYVGAETLYLFTLGGLKINLDAQVIDVHGEIIPGLYSAGRNANITFGHYMASAMAMTDVLQFGRIAGQRAAAETAWA